jgi:hypothetical protein
MSRGNLDLRAMMSSRGPQRHLPTIVQAEADLQLRTCARASVPGCECTCLPRLESLESRHTKEFRLLTSSNLTRFSVAGHQANNNIFYWNGLIYDVTRPGSVAVCDSVAITTIVSFQITVRSPAATLAWISIAFPAPKRQTR